MPRNTFSKNERLSSLKEIDQLFKEGKSVTSSPIRIIWLGTGERDLSSPAIRVMFAVPQKKFPRAVDRNRIKRLMREYYRLSKNQLFSQLNGKIVFNLAIVFTGDEVPDHIVIQKALTNALERWLKKIIPVSPTT